MNEKISCAYELRQKLNEKYGNRIDTDRFLSLMEDMVIGKLDNSEICIVVHDKANSISVLVDETLDIDVLKELLLFLKKIIEKSPIFSLRLKQNNGSYDYAVEWDLKNPKQRIDQLLNGEIYSLNITKDITIYS